MVSTPVLGVVVGDWYWNPFYNLAFEEAMYRLGRGRLYARLWRNENAVVVGRLQCVATEVNIDEAYRAGARIVRRSSGGGAVYHDMGNLNYTVAGPPRLLGIRGPYEAYSWLARIVVEALGSLGVRASYEPPVDITVEGMKIAGLAVQWSSQGMLVHGSLLVSTEPSIVERLLLNPTIDAVVPGTVSSRRRRVTRLADWATAGVEEACKALLDTLSDRLGGHEPLEPPVDMLAEADRLYDVRYSRVEWNLKHIAHARAMLPRGLLDKLLELVKPPRDWQGPVRSRPPCAIG